MSKIDNIDLSGKRILFFSVSVFGYEKQIKQKLEKFGATVDMFNDRPSNSVLDKILIRIHPKLLKWKVKKYYKNIVDETKKNEYDYVFFIKCETPTQHELELLKKANQNSIFILALMDSLANIKGYEWKKEYFNKIFSFDRKDVEMHSEMILRPLFYVDSFRQNKVNANNIKYMISFIGTIHSDRAKIVNQIRIQMDALDKSYFLKIYTPARIIFLYRILFDKDYRQLYKCGHITLKTMDSREIAKIYDETNIVLDIEHPKQSGLTMRTIELIGMKKKIATTNTEVKYYDFYNENNIIILDRFNVKIDNTFFDKSYYDLPLSIYDSYSLNDWIKNIFYDKEDNDD